MSYELYRYIFLGSLIACGIFLVLAAVLFFTLKIPKVISDLTGRTARKAIETIRLQNEQSGDKTYQSSAVNLERGKLTDKISQSGRLVTRDETPFGTGVITEKISTQRLAPDGQTDVLNPADETAVLAMAGGETALLTPAAGETAVLTPEAGETAVLAPTEPEPPAPAQPVFAVEFEITFIHTDEMIV